jgi:hypothetical protein
MFNNNFRISIVLSSLLLLSGCDADSATNDTSEKNKVEDNVSKDSSEHPVDKTKPNENDTDEIKGTGDSSISGLAVDGYIQNGLVCLDLNINEKCDKNEPSTSTDDNGKFTFSNIEVVENAIVLVTGGVDSDTKLPFSGVLYNTYHSDRENIVTPITSLVIDVARENGTLNKETIAKAKNIVSQFLGIKTENIDKDPVALFESGEDKDSYKRGIELVKLKSRLAGGNISLAKEIKEGEVLSDTLNRLSETKPKNRHLIESAKVILEESNSLFNTNELKREVVSQLLVLKDGEISKLIENDANVSITQIRDSVELIEDSLNEIELHYKLIEEEIVALDIGPSYIKSLLKRFTDNNVRGFTLRDKLRNLDNIVDSFPSLIRDKIHTSDSHRLFNEHKVADTLVDGAYLEFGDVGFFNRTFFRGINFLENGTAEAGGFFYERETSTLHEENPNKDYTFFVDGEIIHLKNSSTINYSLEDNKLVTEIGTFDTFSVDLEGVEMFINQVGKYHTFEDGAKLTQIVSNKNIQFLYPLNEKDNPREFKSYLSSIQHNVLGFFSERALFLGNIETDTSGLVMGLDDSREFDLGTWRVDEVDGFKAFFIDINDNNSIPFKKVAILEREGVIYIRVIDEGLDEVPFVNMLNKLLFNPTASKEIFTVIHNLELPEVEVEETVIPEDFDELADIVDGALSPEPVEETVVEIKQPTDFHVEKNAFSIVQDRTFVLVPTSAGESINLSFDGTDAILTLEDSVHTGVLTANDEQLIITSANGDKVEFHLQVSLTLDEPFYIFVRGNGVPYMETFWHARQ